MKGYKVFNPDFTCNSGFHFCESVSDCFSYYSEEKESDSKRVCSKLTIVRQMSWEEVLRVCNSGNGNSTDYSSGYFNSVPEGSYSDNPTEEEKDSIEYKTTGHIIRVYPYSYKEAWAIAWSKMTQEQKDTILKNEYFDTEIFFEITGIQIKGE